MSAQWAIDVIAQHILARAAEEAGDDGWEYYAEIGEYDWERVVEAVQKMAPWPGGRDYAEAYRSLEERAEKCTTP